MVNFPPENHANYNAIRNLFLYTLLTGLFFLKSKLTAIKVEQIF